MPDLARLHAKIHGFVQGVSFRYYTLRHAQGLGLDGFVRNCWDGTVEVVAEGERGAVRRLLSWLQAGPPSADVSKVDHKWEAPRGNLTRFEVRF
jgi:acylphosphatase